MVWRSIEKMKTDAFFRSVFKGVMKTARVFKRRKEMEKHEKGESIQKPLIDGNEKEGEAQGKTDAGTKKTKCIEGQGSEAVLKKEGDSSGTAKRDEKQKVLQSIIEKAKEGNIKHQELYLKYIDLFMGLGNGDDEVIYTAEFIDDKKEKT
jgi:hypothetical protein